MKNLFILSQDKTWHASYYFIHIYQKKSYIYFKTGISKIFLHLRKREIFKHSFIYLEKAI